MPFGGLFALQRYILTHHRLASQANTATQLWSQLDLEVSPIKHCSDLPGSKFSSTSIELLVRHAPTFGRSAKPNPHRLNIERFPGSIKPPNHVPQARLNNVHFDISLSDCADMRSRAGARAISTDTGMEDMIDEECHEQHEESDDNILQCSDGANVMPSKNQPDQTPTTNSENTQDEFFEKTLPLLDKTLLLAVLGRANRRKLRPLIVSESSFEALSAVIPSIFRPNYLEASSQTVKPMSHPDSKVP